MTRRAAAGYRAVHRASLVDGATPHALTAMLYDGAIARIELARRTLQQPVADEGVRRRAIADALAIVQELQGALRDVESNALSARLFPLYQWICARLLSAGADRDAAALDEAQALLEPLRDAWRRIAPDTVGGARHD